MEKALQTTTTSVSTDAFGTWLLCRCAYFGKASKPWKTSCAPMSSILHSLKEQEDSMVVEVSSKFLEYAKIVQSHRNQHMFSLAAMCFTPELKLQDLKECLPPNEYERITPLTCGGISRIYSAVRKYDETPVIIKVTCINTTFALKELECYDNLASKGFRVPEIYFAASYIGKYQILVMPRLAMTLSTAFLCIARMHDEDHSALLDALLKNTYQLILSLYLHKISFCDLSPDNIMLQPRLGKTSDRLDFYLIDPQFAVDTELLACKVPHRWARSLDRIHFAYKVRLLSIVCSPEEQQRMSFIANRVCTILLDTFPTSQETREWLMQILPKALRISLLSRKMARVSPARAAKESHFSLKP
jgi:hypothetical protein